MNKRTWNLLPRLVPTALPRMAFSLGSLSLLIVATLASETAAADAPLHEQIDKLVGEVRPGPAAPRSSDEEFLRRVYIDLVGTLPSSETTRTFLANRDADKRMTLVDELLDDPRFDIQFMRLFDSMLMERLPEKNVKPHEFRAFLMDSVAKRKPLDQMFREVVAADGVDDETQSAVRFLMDRNSDAHVITRDIGRLLLGVDMQCAQCHDHPSIDDYRQEDYYGLYSFVSRSFLHTDKDLKRKVIAEKAEGDPMFVSVFVGGDPTFAVPHLPGGAPIHEPEMSEDDRYLVKPEKDARPVPRFSRRKELAREITSGRYPAFQRNLANRIWAHVMGRGLVHPLDLHHGANPPVHPPVLNLISDSLVEQRFDLRGMIRELMATQTYQQSSNVPDQLKRVARSSKRDPEELLSQLDAHKKELAAAKTEREEILARIGEFNNKKRTLEAALAEAEKKAKGPAEKLAGLRDRHTKASEGAKATTLAAAEVEKLAAAAAQTAKSLPDDKEVGRFQSEIVARAEKLRSNAKAAEAKIAELATELSEAEKQHAQVAALVETAKRAVADHGEVSPAWHTQRQQRDRNVQSKRSAVTTTKARLEDLRILADYADAVREQGGDSDFAADQWNIVVRRWRERFYTASVRPLTQEQMAWSVMQALGVMDRYRQQSADNLAKAKKKQAASDAVSPDEAAKDDGRKIVRATYAIADRHLYGFIINFSGPKGQPNGVFTATPREPLFLRNNGMIQSWVQGGDHSLLERLQEIEASEEVAEELYLATLSRLPSTEEAAFVGAFLSARPDNRVQTLQDLISAIIESAEFRFRS